MVDILDIVWEEKREDLSGKGYKMSQKIQKYWKNYSILVDLRTKREVEKQIATRKWRVSEESLHELKDVMIKIMQEIDKDYIVLDFVEEFDIEEVKKTRNLPGMAFFFTKKITNDKLFAEEVRKYT